MDIKGINRLLDEMEEILEDVKLICKELRRDFKYGSSN